MFTNIALDRIGARVRPTIPRQNMFVRLATTPVSAGRLIHCESVPASLLRRSARCRRASPDRGDFQPTRDDRRPSAAPGSTACQPVQSPYRRSQYAIATLAIINLRRYLGDLAAGRPPAMVVSS